MLILNMEEEEGTIQEVKRVAMRVAMKEFKGLSMKEVKGVSPKEFQEAVKEVFIKEDTWEVTIKGGLLELDIKEATNREA